MGHATGISTHTPPLVLHLRAGIGALLCALLVACGSSPKEPARSRTAPSSKGSKASPPKVARKAESPSSKKLAPTRSAAQKNSKTQTAKSGAPGKNGAHVGAPASPGAAAGTFLWPASGTVINRFNGGTSKGIDIRGESGDSILAAAKGRVVYVGSELRGYGHLVMVKHENGLLTAYAHNRKIFVRENQQVQAGQKIAEMGSTDTNATKLHFEVRRNGVAVDPMPYLKSRSAR